MAFARPDGRIQRQSAVERHSLKFQRFKLDLANLPAACARQRNQYRQNANAQRFGISNRECTQKTTI